ncbi:MAG: CoA transferase, partial [Betaproteobacteria bacterium]
MSTNQTLPLSGIRVVEFTHMVMGPSCGLVLADLG